MALPRLTRWYRTYNEKYFNNELPEDIKLLWESHSEHLGTVRVDEKFEIRINPVLAIIPPYARLCLLHEMVHVKLWPSIKHGSKFQAEMMRLALEGAFRKLW